MADEKDVKQTSEESAEEKLRKAVKGSQVAEPDNAEETKPEEVVKETGEEKSKKEENPEESEVVEESYESETKDEEEEEEEPKDNKVGVDLIPRKRLNQEIDKRKELEKRMESLQFKLSEIESKIGDKQTKAKEEAELEKDAQETADELGISLESAKKILLKQESRAKHYLSKEIYELRKENADTAYKSRLKEAIGKNKFAVKYEKEINDKLSIMPIELKSDPYVIAEAIKATLGEKVLEIANDIAKSAVKQVEEKKKIIPMNQEKPNASEGTKSKLTDDEKFMASKLKITEEQYLSGKKKR
ncbi:MAG: hypothetical protein WC390_09030 [Sulfurimonas sp.]|jgi:hypothetical protein